MADVRDRIQAFMRQRKLTRAQMAEALGTSIWTMDGWRKGATPAAAVARLMDLIEQDSRVRSRLGVVRGKKVPHGNWFKPGNPWRIGSPTREAALAEAKKRREKS